MSKEEEAAQKKGSVLEKWEQSHRKGKWKTESITGEIMRSGAETQSTGKLHPTS